MTSTAENIALAVQDVRTARFSTERASSIDEAEALGALSRWLDSSMGLLSDAPVVDATALHRSFRANPRPWDPYAEHPSIAPPWPGAFIAFELASGVVIVTAMTSVDTHQERRQIDGWGSHPLDRWEGTEHPIDWERVRWVIGNVVFVGGMLARTGPDGIVLRNENGEAISSGRRGRTFGPVFLERYAVYEDGSPADLHWTAISPRWKAERLYEPHLHVNLATLNFMNCRNVELVDSPPARDRAERRRIARTGVRFSHLNVFPAGHQRRGGGQPTEGSVPLSSVRGHFAKYGPDYDRGLLFGRHAGRFWRPQHARGHEAEGETVQDFTIHPEAS